jgi:uncharacterized cupredoxin-like copper-binding protein
MSRRAASLLGVVFLLTGGAALWGAAASASSSSGARTVHITIHFSRFDTADIPVKPGETVRFVIENTDPIDHEFIVGNAHVQHLHEIGTDALHESPGAVTVPAGQTRETTYTFPMSSPTMQFACHLPGHFAYGMAGTVTIG